MAEKGISGFLKALTFQSSVPNIAFAWLGLVIFGSVFWIMGSMFLPSTIPAFPLLAVGGVAGSGMATGGQIQSVGQDCPADMVVPLYVKASYNDPAQGNQELLVSTDVAIFDTSDPLTLAYYGSTDTTGYTSSASFPCGRQFNIFFGDGGESYYYSKLTHVAQGGRVDISAKLKRSSLATLTVANTTTFGVSSVGVNIGTGETNSDVSVKVKAGTYYFGDGAFEICALYNTANISKVSFGANAIPISPDPSITTTTNTRLDCYEVAGDKLYNNAYVDLPVVIKAISGVNPTNTNITLYINDKTCYLKNGECTPSYIDTDTYEDLGLDAVALTNAIRVS